MIGALIGAGVSAFGAHMRNEQAQQAAAQQMAFQKETLQNQYQWATEDMRRAGINPMLAYQQGGAGSAGGSTYAPENVGAAAMQGSELEARSAAERTAARLAQERQFADLSLLDSQTTLNTEQQRTQLDVQARERAQASLASAQARQSEAMTRILGEELQSAKAAAAASEVDEEFYKSEGGQLLRLIERGFGALRGGAAGARDLSSLRRR